MTQMRQADPEAFLAGLKRGGATMLTSVPCSSMTGLINAAERDRSFLFANAPNEGEALAFAAGSRLGGQMAVVLCQNSGLGNLANALTSMIVPYRIPVLLIIGWRGQPGVHDEPQHRLVGRLTRPFLKSCGVEIHVADAQNAVRLAEICARTVADGGSSQAILVPTKLFREAAASDRATATWPYLVPDIARDMRSSPPNRREALSAIIDAVPSDAVLIAPTGLASRELCALRDLPSQFYMMGSMGHGAALGAGVAATTDRPVVLLDGDGAILMRLGTLAFVGAMVPANLLHIVLDNGIHESTGGQASLSNGVDLCAVAAACGYRSVAEVASAETLNAVLDAPLPNPGPRFIRLHMRASEGAVPPRIPWSAEMIATRFSEALQADDACLIDKTALAGAE